VLTAAIPTIPARRSRSNGAKLGLFVPDGQTATLDVRFDPPDGLGSFWEALRRTLR